MKYEGEDEDDVEQAGRRALVKNRAEQSESKQKRKGKQDIGPMLSVLSARRVKPPTMSR